VKELAHEELGVILALEPGMRGWMRGVKKLTHEEKG